MKLSDRYPREVARRRVASRGDPITSEEKTSGRRGTAWVDTYVFTFASGATLQLERCDFKAWEIVNHGQEA